MATLTFSHTPYEKNHTLHSQNIQTLHRYAKQKLFLNLYYVNTLEIK